MAAQRYTPDALFGIRDKASKPDLGKTFRNKLRDQRDLSDRKLDRIPEETREASQNSGQTSKPKPRQLDGTASEWRYRGRSDSEDAQPQPISAPAGLAAQKSEGFQRFYRAVVSPTHVRVTAGGRIVPNNRPSSSPTTKWAKEKVGSETMPSLSMANQGQPDQSLPQLPQIPMSSIPPMYTGYVPNMSSGMAPAPSPYTLVPWHMGLGMNLGGFGIPMIPGPQAFGTGATMKKPHDADRGENKSESSASDKAASSKPPPPEYPDHSQAMFFNGHWMIPPGPQYYPFGFPTTHGIQGSFGPAWLDSAGIGKPAPDRSKGNKNDQATENEVPSRSGFPNPSHADIHGSKNLPVSSIRPSEITKRHIDILRTRLKYLEDQLQFNKHQIDERSVENDAQTARQYIEQFERTLEIQLSTEGSPQPTKEKGAQSQDMGAFGQTFKAENLHNPSAFSDRSGAPQGPPMSANKMRNGFHTTAQTQAFKKPFLGRPRREKAETRFSSGINSTKSVSAFAGWQHPDGSIPSFHQSNRTSALPISAALAPPFQPRSTSSSMVPNVADSSIGRSSLPSNIKDEEKLQNVTFIGEKLNWEVFSDPYVFLNPDKPYLIGRAPPGVRPDHIQDIDFTYERELTEDELRARHMYWGKAPRHLQKGLPKFDGKDFFPPSPSKILSGENQRSGNSSVPGANEEIEEPQLVSDPIQLMSKTGHIFSRNGPGNSTQSESLPQFEETVILKPVSFNAQKLPGNGKRTGRSLDHVERQNHGSIESSSSNHQSNPSIESEEETELVFSGRNQMSRPSKTFTDIWTSVLKRGVSSAGAAPGAVSATTAQGVLPHYSGHAAASLTPSITNRSSSPRNGLAKPYDGRDSNLGAVLSGKRGENCPPRSSFNGSRPIMGNQGM